MDNRPGLPQETSRIAAQLCTINAAGNRRNMGVPLKVDAGKFET